jgi:hypothetical protein
MLPEQKNNDAVIDFHPTMPVTILSSQPDLSGEVVRHNEAGVKLDVSPPLAGLSGDLIGDLNITERY